MATYIIRRLLHMIPTLFVISILAFTVIQLPPGDFFDALQAELADSDSLADKEAFNVLREQYHLDEPVVMQYLYWIGGCLKGDFGYSFEWRRPVSELIAKRLGLTFVLSLTAMVLIYLIAVPIGVYSACNQHKVSDYVLTFVAFIGICIPNFILALAAVYVSVFYLGGSVGGLFSAEFQHASWSLAKLADFLEHLWIPVVVIAAGGTAQTMRVMRNSMLNVLKEQYITTARAKGVPERRVIYKYGLRVAINPMITAMGMQLPRLISGSVIISVVLALPTTGPMFLRALQTQDMYLAGTFLMFMAVMLLVGNLLADIALAISDPRIRLE